MKKSIVKRRVRRVFGFTLTELLVVVVIVGVLSAVAVPKFTRAVETRRAAEAEEMLTAVRTEQEKRCSLDQPYAGYFDKLGEFVSSGSRAPQAVTAHYEYRLGEKGVSASRTGKDYSLSVPSYADGRLCCSGSYCEKLNKNYPLCAEMTDLKVSSCSAPLCEVSKQCSPGEKDVRDCECGSQTRTCGETCQWGSYSGSCYAKYGGTGKTRSCSSGCGTQVSVSTCSGESWSGSCWSPSGGGSESTSCSNINSSWEGTATRYCSSTCSGSGSCGGWDTSGCSAKDPCAGKTCSGPSSRSCPAGTSGTQYRTCNCGTWSDWQGSCTPIKPIDPCAGKTCSGPSTQSCPSGYTGTQTRTCSCGVWSAWQGTCTPKPTCSDASYKASHKSECCPSASKMESVCWNSKKVVKVKKANVCSCRPCAMAAFPTDENIKLCGWPGTDECSCIATYYTNGRGCSVTDRQYCDTEYFKNGW